MKVILASNNANKLREMQQILSPLGWEICGEGCRTPFGAGENGETFEENSLIKAGAVRRRRGFRPLPMIPA